MDKQTDLKILGIPLDAELVDLCDYSPQLKLGASIVFHEYTLVLV